MKSVFIGTAIAALLSGSALAEAIKVGDLGAAASRKTCMATAEAVLNAYVNQYGGHAANGDPSEPEGWSYYGWDLRPGNIDAVIICPVVGNQVNAFFTLHSAGDNDAGNASVAAERIRELWLRLY